MLHAKNVPGRFWAECMKTATHVINRLPQARLGFVSPFQKLWNTKPTVSHFQVFGCVCYVFVPNHLRSKFDKKAVRCIFVGYDGQRKGWRCYNPTNGHCYTSRDVIFDEASSWWLEEKATLPKEIKDKNLESTGEQSRKDQLTTIDEVKLCEDHEPESREITQSPWQTGVYHRTLEEDRPRISEVEEEDRVHSNNLEGHRDNENPIPSMQMWHL